ncbi:unnamed protein product [Parajaminaea phylloscopi]
MSLVDDPTTKLLTLLNVSATQPGKRKRSGEAYRPGRLGGKRSAEAVIDRLQEAAAVVAAEKKSQSIGEKSQLGNDIEAAGHGQGSRQSASLAAAADSDDESAPRHTASGQSSSTERIPEDAFSMHFASEGPGTLAEFLEGKKAEDLQWTQRVDTSQELGKLVTSTPSLASKSEAPSCSTGGPHATVLESWKQLCKTQSRRADSQAITPMQQHLVSRLSLYGDFYHSSLPIGDRKQMREAVACHAVSHAVKTRRRILKNNERIAHAAAAGGADIDTPRDQGFTRPKVLVLAPMRNSALEWVRVLEALSGCPQVDNKGRLEREYKLPDGAVDKLTQPDARDRYPLDHLDTFSGNIDDNFQLGIKLTRKSLKLFSAFYESDFIVASPLALRLAIEKDRDADFLSSIEILVMDQMDVMTMQNWDHVQFVLSHLNQIPKQSHDTDFSRVKQWYLDGKAPNFRQSILLSTYDAPEMRGVFSHSLQNIGGKSRTLQDSSAQRGIMSEVRQGIRQSFVRFDCANLQTEHDLRFQYFTKKTLPNLLKSAMSATKTLIFIPSYFDFVRVEDYMRQEQLSFASISEYSQGKDVARARQQFLSGKRSFLLMTERFHFYRRYVIRGAQTIVFYALPEHKDYFAEALSFPFARTTSLVQALQGDTPVVAKSRGSVSADGEQVQEEELDPSDVSTVALYSRYDLLRLQRIVGMELAGRMIEEETSTWRFT